jgi:thioredoxin 2
MIYSNSHKKIQFGANDLTEKCKVSCPNCGATNNYPLLDVGKKVVCGRCRSVLPKPGTVIEPTPEQMQALLYNASLPVLVDFYSPTCAPCHMMFPIVESLAARRAGEISVIKINVDTHQQIAAAFSIRSVPTFVIVHKGNERDRMSGAVKETDFSLWVASRV